MGFEKEKEVRAIISDLLKTGKLDSDGRACFQIKYIPDNLTAKWLDISARVQSLFSKSHKSSLHDDIFLSFLSGSHLPWLGVALPPW